MSEVKNGWGFQSDNDESLTSKVGGKFGLNKANITVFEYNGQAGKDGADADAIDITVAIGDKEYRTRIYDITGDLFKGRGDRIAPGEPGYAELYNAEKKQKEAVVIHAIKALGATEDQIKMALQTGNVVDFKSWATAICNLKPAGFETMPVDFFLEYQWQPTGENTMTFLQFPKNMKGGRFLCAHIAPAGSWREETTDEGGLRYVDDNGAEHPFSRNANYMESPKANQINENEEEESEDSEADANAMSGTTSTKSNW